MTIPLLASVFLIALVVTSHPILPVSDSDQNVRTLSATQGAGQAAFQAYPGKDKFNDDAAGVRFLTAEQQSGYVSQLGEESVEAMVSLGLVPGRRPPVEATLLSDLVDEEDWDSNDMLARNRLIELHLSSHAGRPLSLESASGQSIYEQAEASSSESDETSSAPFLVLLLSCTVALLVLACMALALYVAKYLSFQVLASNKAWEVLPRVWKRSKSSRYITASSPKPLHSGNCFLLQTDVEQQSFDTAEGTTEKCGLLAEGKLVDPDVISDIDSDWDDVEEKYQDAVDMTPLPPISSLPPDGIVHLDQSCLMDTLLRSSQDNTSDQQPRLTPEHSTPAMRESCSSAPFCPPWSVCAINPPLLGISSSDAAIDAASRHLIHPRRRAYRSAVPEFDIALAMQLRPGLGIGADPAWMVRFLMAIFGWFAVALTGN